MSCAEALRRCPQAVFVRPRHALYREYSQAVWNAVREVVPTVERTGIDEGYLDLGEVAADFLERARARRGGAGGRPRRDEPDVLARRRDVQGRRQGRERPAQAGRADRRAAGPRGGVPRAVRRAPAARGRPARRGAAAAAAASTTIGALAALDDDELRRLLPGKVGGMLRDRARGIDPRGPRDTGRARLDQQRGDVRARHRRPRPAPRRAAADGRRASPSICSATARAARTVTTKVRYSDFSIRSRSTSLPVGTDDAERSASSPARCLDRALADRPGALRLVGVGLSGLESHQQLALV